MAKTLLLVDDDAGFREVYREILSEEGYRVVEAANTVEAETAFARHRPDIVVLDLMLPPSGSPQAGAALCKAFVAQAPKVKVVTVSGTADTQAALQTVRQGAYDFLTKPVEPDVLLMVLHRACARIALEERVFELQQSLAPGNATGMIGSAPTFLAARALCEKVAPTDVPVLITGATGTGKEVFARHLHQQSRRSDAPFIAVNCGALGSSLLESTLFGHKKGAFTGAVRDEPGLLVAAHTGTLFLDEIGDMDVSLQVKLLRALETGDVVPVGSTKSVQVDVRIVSATHKPLQELIQAGSFREDLFWRIRGIEIELPKLAERVGDLPLLAQHFLNQARLHVPNAGATKLSDDALRHMESYHWPGNLRELRHEMQRALVLSAGGPTVLAEDLSPAITAGQTAARNTKAAEGQTLDERLAVVERQEIIDALGVTGGNKTQAAKKLGLSRQGLANKLHRHGIS